MSASPSAGAPIAEVIAIVGATGTGKSELALDLASGLHEHGLVAEVVNADAMQLYAGMDIGTAKLPLQDRRGVPHHLLDVLSVTEDSSVADYQARARASIDDILARGTCRCSSAARVFTCPVCFSTFSFPAPTR